MLKTLSACLLGGLGSAFRLFWENTKEKMASTREFLIARRCSKFLCEKDDQRTYSYDPLKNIYGVSPPLGAFSSGCPIVTSLSQGVKMRMSELMRDFTPIGCGFRGHKNYGQLRIACSHVLVRGHRKRSHFPTPPEEINREECLF